jgi:hypothetical protein
LQADYIEKRLSGYKDTVAFPHNRISTLDADQKAMETELKAKLWSAQLTAKKKDWFPLGSREWQ